MEYAKAEQEIERVQKLNSDLLKVKDATKAAAVVRKHSSTIQNFESLTETAKHAIGSLPFHVREALYYYVRGDDYQPEQWDDDVTRAIENGQLASNIRTSAERLRLIVVNSARTSSEHSNGAACLGISKHFNTNMYYCK